MDTRLFKSAVLKCRQAEREVSALSTIDDDVTYETLLYDCFRSKQAVQTVRPKLKKVSDLVTEKEFAALLKWSAFHRGWRFAQRYLFEERLGLNKEMHAALEAGLHHLPTRKIETELQTRTFVKTTVLSPKFRLIKIVIDVPYEKPFGDFILELTDNFCFLLNVYNGWRPPLLDVFRFEKLSPQMLSSLERKTKMVRALMNAHLSSSFLTLEEMFFSYRENLDVYELSCFVKRFRFCQWLQICCRFCKHASRTEWNAVKKAFGVGGIIRRLDRDGSAGELGPFRWSAGSLLRTIWFELPYDIEIPIFRQNGDLYILRTVPDLKKI